MVSLDACFWVAFTSSSTDEARKSTVGDGETVREYVEDGDFDDLDWCVGPIAWCGCSSLAAVYFADMNTIRSPRIICWISRDDLGFLHALLQQWIINTSLERERNILLLCKLVSRWFHKEDCGSADLVQWLLQVYYSAVDGEHEKGGDGLITITAPPDSPSWVITNLMKYYANNTGHFILFYLSYLQTPVNDMRHLLVWSF